MQKEKFTWSCQSENAMVKPKNVMSEGSCENNTRFTLRTNSEVMNLVENHFQNDNCSSKSEFIEKAIKFYTGYLEAEKNVNYLSPMITDAVDAAVGRIGHRISQMLFKSAVELGNLTYIMADYLNIDDCYLQQINSAATENVKKINGVISLENAVHSLR